MIGQNMNMRMVDSGAKTHYFQPAGEKELELNCAGSLSAQIWSSYVRNLRLILQKSTKLPPCISNLWRLWMNLLQLCHDPSLHKLTTYAIFFDITRMLQTVKDVLVLLATQINWRCLTNTISQTQNV